MLWWVWRWIRQRRNGKIRQQCSNRLRSALRICGSVINIISKFLVICKQNKRRILIHSVGIAEPNDWQTLIYLVGIAEPVCLCNKSGDWCLAQWLNLVHLCGEDVGSNPAWTVFLSLNKNIQYPVKSFAPYLGGRRGRVPSDSLRKFLQEVNLYNLFKHFM